MKQVTVKEMIQNIENGGQDPKLRRAKESEKIRKLKEVFENEKMGEQKDLKDELGAVRHPTTSRNLEFNILGGTDDDGGRDEVNRGAKSKTWEGPGAWLGPKEAAIKGTTSGV